MAACRAPGDSRPDASPAPAGVVVLSVRDGWGAVATDPVEQVFASAAGALLEHAPGRIRHPISVRPAAPGDGQEAAPSSRWEGGHFVVRLDILAMFWDAYTYELAHELCHVLAVSSALQVWATPEATYRAYRKAPNRWFEEALCEAASLFTLHRMARLWAARPPYPNWREYAPAFTKYADSRLDAPARKLPPGTTLAEWYRQNAAALRDVPVDRPREAIVAGELLPLFERDPIGWEAVSYLNVAGPAEAESLPSLLSAWHREVPARLAGFVAAVSERFGYPLPSDAAR